MENDWWDGNFKGKGIELIGVSFNRVSNEKWEVVVLNEGFGVV